MKPLFAILTGIIAAAAAAVSAQSFDPNGVTSNQRFDPAKVGTNKTTNATYSNPIMTANAADP